MKTYLLLLIVLPLSLLSQVKQVSIMVSKAGIVLDSISIWQDSISKSKVINTLYKGDIVEYIQSSKDLYTSNTSKQQFKYVKVKSDNGTIGWVSGDKIAISIQDRELSELLKPFNKSTFNFGNNFDKSTIWFARLEGLESNSQSELQHFHEDYMVISNPLLKQCILQIGKENVQGKSELSLFNVLQITSDKANQIVLLKQSKASIVELQSQNLAIYSVENSKLNNILNEYIDLRIDEYTKSPALCKIVEIEENTLRIAYPNYQNCENNRNEICVNYVTNTLIWNKSKSKFTDLYNESIVPINGSIKENSYLYAKPNDNENIGVIASGQKIIIESEYLNYKQISGKKIVEPFFKIKYNQADYYIQANKVRIEDIEHASILNKYYNPRGGDGAFFEKPPMAGPLESAKR